MSRPVARPIAVRPAVPHPARQAATPRPPVALGTGPQGARRVAQRAQLLQPMDAGTRRMIAAVACEGLDEIVRARLLALGPRPETRGRRRRKVAP